MYSSTLSLTSALDGWSTPRPGRFTPGKDPVPIVLEAGGAAGPVWTGAENIAPPPGFDPRTVQPVACRYTEWAIPAHDRNMVERFFNVVKYDIYIYTADIKPEKTVFYINQHFNSVMFLSFCDIGLMMVHRDWN